jgi:predicted phosphodiesterase
VTLRLAHLSDIHFGGENTAAVAAAAEYLKAGAFDLTVVSGDLTKFGEVAEFKAAAAWLEAVPGPRFVTPGNHDAPYLAWAERVIAPFRRYEAHIGPAPAQTWQGEGVAVRGINTARGAQPRLNWSKGQISRRQAREAADWLAERPGVRIVVVHHPLIEMIGGPDDGAGLGRADGGLGLRGGQVDLVLSGHIHAPFTWAYPDGDGLTWAVGAGTLSVRERGVPPGFNVVEVEDGCFASPPSPGRARSSSPIGPGRSTGAQVKRPRQRGPGPMPRPRTRCMTSETANRIRKTQNRILAMPIAAPATVVNRARRRSARPPEGQSPTEHVSVSLSAGGMTCREATLGCGGAFRRW